MADGLQMRVEPWPNPKIGVFMNKAKMRSGRLTRESAGYWDDTKAVCSQKLQQGMRITPYEAFIPDRVDIKRAIPRSNFPREFERDFAVLWNSVANTWG